MTVSVQNTAVTNTFDFWRNRTNEIADAMTNKAVTVNSNTAAGNAAITGTFTANVLYVANTTSNVSIVVPTTTQTSNGQYYLNANGSWSIVSATAFFTNGVISTTGAANATLVDSYSMTSYNSAEYFVFIKDEVVNAFTTTKLLTIHNTSNAYVTEYGSIPTNNSIGTFSANANSTHVTLYFTPVTANTTVKFVRTVL